MDYIKVCDVMFEYMDLLGSFWFVVNGNNKKKVCFNCIKYFLFVIFYEDDLLDFDDDFLDFKIDLNYELFVVFG